MAVKVILIIWSIFCVGVCLRCDLMALYKLCWFMMEEVSFHSSFVTGGCSLACNFPFNRMKYLT